MSRIALRAILVLLVAASSGAATAHFLELRSQEASSARTSEDDRDEDCPAHLNGFHQAVVWQSGGKRLLIEAAQACGDKLGHTFELENVTLSMMEGNSLIARLKSPSAVFSLPGNRVVLGSSTGIDTTRCLGDPALMSIDLASSEIRMPGQRFFLNRDNPIPCEKKTRRL